jgi:hypothetical protein
MICVDCGTSAPRSAAPTWLAMHTREAHHLPRHLECAPCQAQSVVASLQEVRDWAWRHATCGLPDKPELCSSLTKRAAVRRTAAWSGHDRLRQPIH